MHKLAQASIVLNIGGGDPCINVYPHILVANTSILATPQCYLLHINNTLIRAHIIFNCTS